MIDGNTAAEFERSYLEDKFDEVFGVEKTDGDLVDDAWDEHQAEILS